MTDASGGRVVAVTDCDLPHDIAASDWSNDGTLVRLGTSRTEADVLELASDADAVLVQWAPITARVIAELERCRIISRLGIGYDMIDVEAATARGIAVANVPDYCTEEVAVHAMAMILAGLRSLWTLDRAVRDGRWGAMEIAPNLLRPSQATVAIVGFGRIGSRVASLVAATGSRVLVHDPYVAPVGPLEQPYLDVTLDDALAEADVVSLHLPLTEATRHLIGAPQLASMKPGAFLVNTCRGGLVDESALAGALTSGTLSGAALDVFENEPLPRESPLLALPNVVLSPHAAWYSVQALQELPRIAFRQAIDFLEGRPVANVVNPEYSGVADLDAALD